MSLIIEHLYLSPIVVSRDLAFFKAQKISRVLIAAKNLRQHFQQLATYKQLNLSDNPQSCIIKYFVESIKFIHEALSARKNVLVHCLGGISRSVSIVIAYLMFILNISFEKALEFVKKRHSKADPNPGFRAQLKAFEKCIIEYKKLKEDDSSGTIDYRLLDTLIGMADKNDSGKAKKK